MSKFECNIKDLIETVKEIPKPKVSSDNANEDDISERIVPMNSNRPREGKKGKNNNMDKNTPSLTEDKMGFLSKIMKVENRGVNKIIEDISDKKNYIIFLTVIGLYILLNSSQIYKLINTSFPFLMESSTAPNFTGKLVIAFIISVSVIISKSLSLY